MASTQYFVSSRTGALLRREPGEFDTVWRPSDGWQRTNTLLRYAVGSENDVDEVTESKARADYPDAF